MHLREQLLTIPPLTWATETGSAIEHHIICPTRPGGNVSTWLYLTSTNRTAKGVEAFVSYYAQDPFRFKVFDWARSDHWQVDLPYNALTPYLYTLTLDGTAYQTVYMLNFTYQTTGSTWTNEAYLLNFQTWNSDLIYRYNYTSSSAEQKSGWIGSWGPIVETFQDNYIGTNRLGFAYTNVAPRTGSTWGYWTQLTPSNTDIRNDNLGFQVVKLYPNYTFIVRGS